MSADTLTRAHKEHPIAALQTEYSLWTRNAEIAVLDACKSMNIAFVGFSPLARGFLSNTFSDVSELEPKDIRCGMPRFQGENWQANRKLYAAFVKLAEQAGCTPAQLAIKWVLAQGEFIHALPGTRIEAHMLENIAASTIEVSGDILIHKGGLETLNNIFRLSKKSKHRIYQNLFLAFVYNTLMIPLAVVGLITPNLAALAMALSSISVVINSSRKL